MKRELIYVILFVATLTSCITQERVSQASLIAHAGGEIEGNTYTNSLEAMLQATENGYRFIEFDLLFTSDSVLVAAHSWEEFNKITGYAHKGDSAPAFADFSSRLIHGRYRPLSASDINDHFMKTPGIYLVTDKVSDPDVLGKYFPELKERMVVEAFSYGHYSELVEQGYFRVLYSCMASDLKSTLLKNLLFDKLFPGRRIEWVALYTGALDNGMFTFLNRWRKFNIALFTVDDYDEIPKKFSNRASMIYTNRIKPEK